MARIMAIDYGRKRVGIAVTDSLKIIASGLTTVAANNIFDFIANYMLKEDVECIVVGEPKSLKNELTEGSIYTEPFVKKIKKLYPDMRIERIDERFTSKLAFQSLIDSGVKKKERRNKALIDEVSATIILQSFLDQQQNM